MAISSSDIKYKLSTKLGSAGNSLTQADVNLSLGKYISTTEISGTPALNLFDNISGDSNAASVVDYRCFFLANAHATLTMLSTVLWIYSEVSGGASIAIGLDTTAASAIGSSSAQALSITDDTTAPSGVSFSSPTTKGAGLAVGDIPAGYCKAIWVRRTAANTAAKDSDGFTARTECDTSE